MILNEDFKETDLKRRNGTQWLTMILLGHTAQGKSLWSSLSESPCLSTSGVASVVFTGNVALCFLF